MKRRNKYDFVLISGLMIGLVAGILLAPAKGETVRSKVLYRIKSFGNSLASIIINMFSRKPTFEHKSKESGNQLITNAKTKANKLLQDIKTIKSKS